nr:MAG TPA: hypothetical protein [Caudoviricetes sp.]
MILCHAIRRFRNHCNSKQNIFVTVLRTIRRIIHRTILGGYHGFQENNRYHADSLPPCGYLYSCFY